MCCRYESATIPWRTASSLTSLAILPFKITRSSDNVPMARKNGALLEVYYEQLNYEKLSESEAYGVIHFPLHLVSMASKTSHLQWVNLLADFGGQLGLWYAFAFA